MSHNTKWPKSHPFALALSHDVDRIHKTVFHYLFNIANALIKMDRGILKRELRSIIAAFNGDDPFWNFDRIVAVEQDLGVKSTFFFLNESHRPNLLSLKSLILFGGRFDLKIPKLHNYIRWLDNHGWEIGVHGSYYSYKNRNLLAKEKEELEQIVKHKIFGIRQHYLNLEVPETWSLQADLGFEYDSSLGYTDNIGFRWGAINPFFPVHPGTRKRLSVLQIPLSIMDICWQNISDSKARLAELIEKAEAENGIIVVNWHQSAFNPWASSDNIGDYQTIIQECKRRNAWITTLGAVNRYVRKMIPVTTNSKEEAN